MPKTVQARTGFCGHAAGSSWRGHLAQALAEGMVLGGYCFDRYQSADKKKDEKKSRLQRCLLHLDPNDTREKAQRKALRALQQGHSIAQAVCAARDMAHEPGSVWTPESFARYGRKLARKYGISCTVLGKSELEDMDMGGILAVNRGSSTAPCLVILERRIDDSLPTVMLVG